MIREEAITVLEGLLDNPLFSNQHKAAFNIAIHDIKAYHDWNINNLILINKDNYEPLEQEPRKGHWKLVQRGKFIDVCCSNCEAVRIKQYAYNYTIDQLNKEWLKECFECADMRYCPDCGSNNGEVDE